jgi:hypothetical protein
MQKNWYKPLIPHAIASLLLLVLLVAAAVVEWRRRP